MTFNACRAFHAKKIKNNSNFIFVKGAIVCKNHMYTQINTIDQTCQHRLPQEIFVPLHSSYQRSWLSPPPQQSRRARSYRYLHLHHPILLRHQKSQKISTNGVPFSVTETKHSTNITVTTKCRTCTKCTKRTSFPNSITIIANYTEIRSYPTAITITTKCTNRTISPTNITITT